MAQRMITHVGLTVPDLDAAIAWYGDVLGFPEMTPAGEIRAGEGHFGVIGPDLWGERFTSVRMAHIGSTEGGVIELFEFATPEAVRPGDYEYWRCDWSHICVVDPDIDGLVARIAETGGRQRSKIWTFFEGEPYKMVYCEDPWGNLVEVYTHTHAETYGGTRTTDSGQR